MKNQISLFFGDKSSARPTQQLWSINSSQALAAEFNKQPELTSLNHIFALRQTHSTQGYALWSKQDVLDFKPYEFEGDYLITNQPHVGLMVATADCVPVILYDTKNQVVANIHAGWRGTAQNIVLKVLEHMQRDCKTNSEDIQVFIGPNARACCYEVSQDFLNHFPEPFTFLDNGLWKCDLVGYISSQLIEHGVPPLSIDTQKAACTICSLEYCSYRREKEQALRQFSIVALF